jgi:hypothetical protein
MPEGNVLAVDVRLASELTGSQKLMALMRARNGSVASWAISHGKNPSEASFMLNGHRLCADLRDMAADDFALSREEVDLLLPGVA